MENLLYQSFSEINFADSFFSTLRNDYSEFDSWINKKSAANEKAYVLYSIDNSIEGFMYLKIEAGPVTDVTPPLTAKKHLKVGTFKFESAGTRRGERFIKKVFDHALDEHVNDIYVTVFSKHEYLMNLFLKYGFTIYGSKQSVNGTENVLTRCLESDRGHILTNYPRFNTLSNNKYILSIYPTYHTRMLPDSILHNESHDLIKDVSHTNSIHKIYICAMEDVSSFKPGDILITYRTNDGLGPAKYRSVVTSVCVVEEYKNIGDFHTLEAFLAYASSYSVFDKNELIGFYKTKKYPHIIRFTYNIAMKKRVIRDRLIKEVGLLESNYWGVMKLKDEQFSHILSLGEIDESFIVD